MEEELFGVEKSDAQSANLVLERGLFEEAENGTLFLDEISELPLAVQKKLLHYLQSGTIYRMGSEHPVKLSVRVITATSKNLERAMHDGFFNEELYYCIKSNFDPNRATSVRKEDIPSIVEHLLVKLNQEFGMKVEVITTEAQKWLQQYDWPGNVRELENVLSRAMIFTEPGETTLGLKDIKKTLSSSESKDEDPFLPEKSTLGSIMDEYEKTILETALRENDGNKSLTANRLGISLRSLYYKLEKFNLDY